MMLLQKTAGGYGILAVQALLVLVAIAVLAWLFTRVIGPRLGLRGRSSRIRLVERLPLESRKSLCIVEVDGRAILIGVAEGGISLVTKLDGASAPDDRSAGDAR